MLDLTCVLYLSLPRCICSWSVLYEPAVHKLEQMPGGGKCSFGSTSLCWYSVHLQAGISFASLQAKVRANARRLCEESVRS